MFSAEGGEATNSLPRSSSTQRGTRLGSRSSCKERIWSRRNSQSDTSSAEKRPSYLRRIKPRDDIDGDVESNLQRREGVLYRGLGADILGGRGWNNKRWHIQGSSNHDGVR
jgi:hypothetical protein